MNLFIVATRGGNPEAALRELAAELPFFEGEQVQTWGSRAAWICHSPERVGGVRYAHAEEHRLALWSGRPILWSGEHEADGLAPLDPAFYLQRPELDGRFAYVVVDGDRVEARSDPMGAYPLYEGGGFVSNSARLVAKAMGSNGTNMDSLASLLGGGWPLSGDPLPAGVTRVSAEIPTAVPGEGFDPAEAARVLVASLRALAQWPGRPDVVPVTGGRDARLVLAAALRAGFEFETQTGGAEDHPDVVVGRQLAERAGVPHSLAHEPGGYALSQWRRAAELVELMTSGTASLADAAGFPMGPREGPLVLWHTGQGGEIARHYYGSGENLYERFTGERPGRPSLLNREGAERVRAQIDEWIERRRTAGVAVEDLGDMFYLQRRMGTWAGPSHGAQEFVRDATSALWTHRLLPHLLGPPARERALEVFHLRVLEELAPELVDIPFADGTGWAARQRPLQRRIEKGARFARKARGALRRRLARPRPAGPAPAAPADHFALALPEIAEHVLSQHDHDAWAVLDRPRVERLLSSQPAALDEMSRYYVWRLAQVFSRR